MAEASSASVILGIETSCDETAAAVVVAAQDVLSSVVSSQVDLHARYGGVVPEIASRAHVDLLIPVVAQAIIEAGIDEATIDAVAATVGPGLIGSLLVGVKRREGTRLGVGRGPSSASTTSKRTSTRRCSRTQGSSYRWSSCWYRAVTPCSWPWRAMVATACWAAPSTTPPVEAFDKVARYLGLGYPGGPAVDRLAMEGDPTAIRFPRAMLDDGYDFSFSGLKTSVVNHVRKHPDVSAADVCASFQEAVVDVLVTKARRAADAIGAKGMCLGGGVAANSQLRERFLGACVEDGRHGFLPSRAMWHRQRRHGGRRRMVAAAQRRPDGTRRRR